MIDKIKLPHAIVIVGAMLFMAFLAWQKVDTAPVVVGIMTLLGALGFVIHQQGQQNERSSSIQTTVNGNWSRMVELIDAQQRAMAEQSASHMAQMREMADKLAEMIPPSAVPQVIALPAPTENGPGG